MPTFNGARFLAPQIDSILQQSESSFELVIVDDGSTDETPAILLRYAAQDARIRLIPSTKNKGQRQRLHQLSQEARSDLISIADQDDIWHAAKLEKLLAGLGDADLVFGSSHLIDAEDEPFGYTILDRLPPVPNDGDRLLYLFKPSVSAHAAIIRRRLLSERSFFSNFSFDWLQSLDAAFGAGIHYVRDAVTYHRLHGSNQQNGKLVGQDAQNFSLTRLWQHFAESHRLRSTFLQTCGYLAGAPELAGDVRARLSKVYGRCHYHWCERPLPVRLNDAGLFAFVLEELAPLAGSPDDLANARPFLQMLTTGPLHPMRLQRYAGYGSLAAIPY